MNGTLCGAIDEKLLAKIRSIQIHAKYLVNDAFAGEYESAFKGRGIAFEEVREYYPGDDIRRIDWNVMARTGRPHVKIFHDERELTLLFLVDISASSHFGTVSKFKNEIAAEITALLSVAAMQNNDKVGLIVFSDEIERYLPPKKGRAHTWRLIRDILSYRSKSQRTNFQKPIDFLNTVLKRKAIAFLLSDFQGVDFEKTLRATAKHHELIAVSIQDPREMELPPIGFIELEDAETGESVLIDTRKSFLRTQFTKSVRELRRDQELFFRSAGIDSLYIETDKPYVDRIVRYFREREKK